MEVQPPPLAIARKFSKTFGLLLHIKSVIELLLGGEVRLNILRFLWPTSFDCLLPKERFVLKVIENQYV